MNANINHLLFLSFFDTFDGLDFPAFHMAIIAVRATNPNPARPICQIQGYFASKSILYDTLNLMNSTHHSTTSSLKTNKATIVNLKY